MIEHIEQGTLAPNIRACIALTSWKKRINTVGLTFLLATQEHITTSEARMLLIEAWRGGKGNRAQRRQRKKKCRQ